MNEDFLVTPIEDRAKTIVKIKASLYSTSLNELVLRSIDELKADIPTLQCSYCRTTTNVTRVRPKQFVETVNGQEYTIKVVRFPLNTCPECGAEYEDMDVLVHLRELVRNEISNCLCERRPIPNEMNFDELIKM